jgi:phosphatidylglycerol:prolipoprotein diacylglycerol transferase
MLTEHIRVAQLMSVILVIIGIAIIIFRRVKYNPMQYKDAGPLSWPKTKAK